MATTELENRSNLSRFRSHLFQAAVLIGLPWGIVVFGALSFGIHVEALHPLLLKFVITTFLAYSLIFVLPMLFIERYVPSKLAMVLLMYLFFFRKHRIEVPAKP